MGAKSDEAERQDQDSGQAGPDRDGKPKDRPPVGLFVQTMNAAGSVFAASVGEMGATRAETGEVDAAEVVEALRHYHTTPAYEPAAAALLTDHVVVLRGPSGSGRGCAARALLREATDQKMISLAPTLTLKDLAERAYDEKFGYVVEDHEGTAGADHDWLAIRTQVREAGAYLIVTTVETGTARRIEAVRQIRWQRPPLLNLLRAHLPQVSDEVIDSLLTKIPDDWKVRSVADMAARIRAGKPEDEALAEFALAARAQVTEWFAVANRPRREIVEITALCFLEGANRRTFESLTAELENALNDAFPPPEATGSELLPADRATHSDPGGLIRIERVNADGALRQLVTFQSPDVRRNVVAELWSRYPVSFWDAVRDWLTETLGDYDDAELACGIAQLATVADFDEVFSSYLEPWSSGEAGTLGQIAAVYVLWLMCEEESGRRLALQAAAEWSRGDDLDQRLSAMVAFTGELGLRYPIEATRRLWQLMTQGKELSEYGTMALAELFAVLAGSGGRAGAVLTMLDRHVTKYCRPGADQRMLALTMNCVVEVLRVRGQGHGPDDDRPDRQHPPAGQPAVLAQIRGNTASTARVARLWAAALRHSGYHRAAVEAVVAVLQALDAEARPPRKSDPADGPSTPVGLSDALRAATALGSALRDAMDIDEYERLCDHVIATAAKARQRPSDDLVHALLDAIGQRSRTTTIEERG
jgi:hypothetical protein